MTAFSENQTTFASRCNVLADTFHQYRKVYYWRFKPSVLTPALN